MKRLYALLFNLSIISTYSVAKSNKIDTKHQQDKNNKVIQKKSHNKSDNFKLANYKIVNGDTLFTIARRHHTTIAEVELINKLGKDENLKIGRVLRVPLNTYKPTKEQRVSVEKKSKKSKYLTHTIKKGDTLLEIALRNKTTVAEIEKINKFSAKDKKLRLGESLLLPRVAKKKSAVSTKVAKVEKKSKKIAKKSKSTHIVKKGDTLNKIATSYDTTVAKLKKINRIPAADNLKLGEKILLVEKKTATKRSKAIAKKAKKSHIKVTKSSVKSKKLAEKKTTQKIAAKRIAEKRIAEKRIAEKRIADKKIADKKIADKKIAKSKKIALASKKTKRFTKRTTRSQARSENKSIFELLGLSDSSLKLSSAKKQLGKRYVWGAVGPKSFDCSGFTKYVCKKNGIYIPRTSIKQSRVGKRVARKNLKAGDLIFFDTSRRRRGYVNHVGIYIGDNKFIHASSAKRKVVITSLNRPFYKNRFKWGSRVKS